jgi:CRISPR/Cas system-associated endonuclease/helicase Cas3
LNDIQSIRDTKTLECFEALVKFSADVRQSCLSSIQQPRGFYELHAPTGSGKTVSGGLFATGHAAHHGLARVIYVAPFRTIIDQTADIFSFVFGELNVLAHHSTADFWTAGDGHLQRQLAENWDVPVVVNNFRTVLRVAVQRSSGSESKITQHLQQRHCH